MRYKPTISFTKAVTLAAAVVVLFGIGTSWALAGNKKLAPKRLIMDLHFVPPTTCEVTVMGETFSLPLDEERMVLALRKLRREWKSARALGNVETPYRCVGFAIYIAQRAGFRKVDFITDRPAPPAEQVR
ncbi:hypothetical protein [Sphingomonas sp.]|uniref:hypothetical protein n=1 Tax=Sphingomonas sp. TaxID=28214 RepID=UPI002DEE10A1|nr:hypothetical protein [Sphingomonas sp.]